MKRQLAALLSELPRIGLLAALLTLAGAALLAVLLPELRDALVVVVAVAAGLLLLVLVASWERVWRALTGRRALYGANTLVMVAAFLGIVVVANVIAARYPVRLDLTAERRFTLSPQTVQVLQGLQTPVEVIGFFTPFDETRQEDARRLLTEYAARSPRFSFRFVDPEREPALARSYDVRFSGTLVFLSGDRRHSVTTVSEQEFTSALLRVTGQSTPLVVFLAGHGEKDPQNFDPANGYASARQGLERENYQVRTVNLGVEGKVPEDTAVLIIAGPQRPPLPSEVEALRQYLQEGGNALFLLDPETPPEWADLLAPWAIGVLPGQALDPASYLQPDPAIPAILRGQYPFSPITQELDASVFPSAAALRVPETDGAPAQVVPLLRTSPQSWRRTAPGQTRDQAGADQAGPLTLGVAVEPSPASAQDAGGEASPPPGRLIVIGDSDFASERFFGAFSNGDLFLNAVNWLAQEEGLIGVRSRTEESRPLVLSQARWRWFLLSTIVLLPLAVAALGAITWWRRR